MSDATSGLVVLVVRLLLGAFASGFAKASACPHEGHDAVPSDAYDSQRPQTMPISRTIERAEHSKKWRRGSSLRGTESGLVSQAWQVSRGATREW